MSRWVVATVVIVVAFVVLTLILGGPKSAEKGKIDPDAPGANQVVQSKRIAQDTPDSSEAVDAKGRASPRLGTSKTGDQANVGSDSPYPDILDLPFIDNTKLTPDRYDVEAILKYDGRTGEVKKGFGNDGIAVPRDWINTDENHRILVTLLSSQRITFYVDRRIRGLSTDPHPMVVIVPKKSYQVAGSILEAARGNGVLKEMTYPDGDQGGRGY